VGCLKGDVDVYGVRKYIERLNFNPAIYSYSLALHQDLLAMLSLHTLAWTLPVRVGSKTTIDHKVAG
jgi:hypothetical protein